MNTSGQLAEYKTESKVHEKIYNPKSKIVLNTVTGQWISSNGKLFQKLIREGFIYTDKLSDYIEDIWSHNKSNFPHPALIPPLSILARPGICRRFLISVESAVKGGISLFTQEKNKQSSLQNLIQMNYFNENLTILLKFSWEDKETKAWRDIILMKFLNQPNLVFSKYKLNTLYDAFIETNVLEPEHLNLTHPIFYLPHHVCYYNQDHELTNKMSLEELSQYAPEILELLTDNKEKRRQARNRLLNGYKFSKEQVFALIPLQRVGRCKSQAPVPERSEITRSSNKIQKECSEKRKNEGIDFPDHFSLESVKERLDLYNVLNTPDKQTLADIMIMFCIRPAEIKNLRITNGDVTGYAKNRGQQDIPRVFRLLEKNKERAKKLLTWIQEAIISG
ncbi:45645_t:CDS:2, partial [Gigaspora margarita]